MSVYLACIYWKIKMQMNECNVVLNMQWSVKLKVKVMEILI